MRRPLNRPECQAMVVSLLLWIAVSSSADPIPTPEPYAGGRIIPTESVPVDMASEELDVDIRPRIDWSSDDWGMTSQYAYSLCTADVKVRYRLVADQRQAVPILFPALQGVKKITMRLNGHRLRVRMVDDIELLGAYEARWKAIIEDWIKQDPKVSEWVAEARRDTAADREEAPGKSEDDLGHELPGASAFKRLNGRLGRHLKTNAFMGAWNIAHYVVGDWERWGDHSPGAGTPRYLPERVRLGCTRGAALTADPKAPDPFAPWDDAGTLWIPGSGRPRGAMSSPFHLSLGMCELPLRAGDNELTVRYTQNVGMVGAIPTGPRDPFRDREPLCEFSFVLRAAMLWRSLGTLKINVSLPEGTEWAHSFLPGCKTSLADGAGTVTYQGEGLPPKNLLVAFGPYEPRDAVRKSWDAEAAARWSPTEITLQPRWTVDVNDDGDAFAEGLPQVRDGLVACATGGQVVICDLATGKVEHRLALREQAWEETRKGPHLRSCDLVLTADKILVGFKESGIGSLASGVICFDRKTGKRLWEQQLTSEAQRPYTTHVRVLGDRVLGWGEWGTVYSLDLDDGGIAWQKSVGARGVAMSEDGTVYVGGKRGPGASGPGTAMALRLSDGGELWHVEKGYAYGSPIVDDGRLYMTWRSGRNREESLVCLSASDGRELGTQNDGAAWKVGDCLGTPYLLGDILCFAGVDGVRAYAARGRGKLLWKYEAGIPLRNEPAWLGDRAYVVAPGAAVCLDLKTGKPLWRDSSVEIPGAPTASGDTLFVWMRLGGALTAYALRGADESQLAAKQSAGDEPGRVRVHGVPPDDLVDVLKAAKSGSAGIAGLAGGALLLLVLVAVVVIKRRS